MIKPLTIKLLLLSLIFISSLARAQSVESIAEKMHSETVRFDSIETSLEQKSMTPAQAASSYLQMDKTLRIYRGEYLAAPMPNETRSLLVGSIDSMLRFLSAHITELRQPTPANQKLAAAAYDGVNQATARLEAFTKASSLSITILNELHSIEPQVYKSGGTSLEIAENFQKHKMTAAQAGEVLAAREVPALTALQTRLAKLKDLKGATPSAVGLVTQADAMLNLQLQLNKNLVGFFKTNDKKYMDAAVDISKKQASLKLAYDANVQLALEKFRPTRLPASK